MSDPATRPGPAAHGPASTTPGGPAEPSTVTHLLRQLMDDVTTLLRKELALATSEISHSVEEAKRGAGGLVSGGAVLYAGLIFLLASATLGLSEVMPGWAAALIVGGVVALIGFGMVQAGKKKLEPGSFAPDRAADSLRKDKDMIRRETA